MSCMHSRAEPVREARPASEQRSVSRVLADVVSNLQDIFVSEIRLVQVETRAQLRDLRSAGVLIVLGVLAGLLSGAFILLAAVAALSLLISFWLAALLVGLGMAVLCAVALGIGVNLVRSRPLHIDAGAGERRPWTGRPIE